MADKDFTWVHATRRNSSDPASPGSWASSSPTRRGPVPYEWSWGGTVTIVTRSGARFTSTVDAPRGSAPRGIEWSDVEAKYRALMPDAGLPGKRTEESLKVIPGFDR